MKRRSLIAATTAAAAATTTAATAQPRPRIIALEEHFLTPALGAAWARLPEAEREVSQTTISAWVAERLGEIGEERLRRMDETGVDVQVLSPTAPGVQSLPAAEAVALARDTNDLTAEAVRGNPERFQGFAVLPTPDPAAAARELERAVERLGLKGAFLYGRTRDRNLDHPAMLPVFEAAAALRVPVYLHPQSPARGVRDAYYSGFDARLDTAMATSGIGWHYETGVQILRLVLAGVFDRFENLQLVTGHWGQVVLFYLDRVGVLGEPARLRRPVADYFRAHLHVTPAGIFSARYLRWAAEVLGPERILFATDYPYRFAPDGGARAFLEAADLSPEHRAGVAHGNWERLTRR